MVRQRPAPKNNPTAQVMTGTITFSFDLGDGTDIGDAVECLREAVDKLRELGAATAEAEVSGKVTL